MRPQQLLEGKRAEILRVAQKHGAHNVRVFGSVARGEADQASDIDFLVDMEPGRSLSAFCDRNRSFFPEDFMCQLNAKELADLKSQIVISSWGGARRAAPYAFTEQGVAMLSSVLRSKRAVMANIQIMQALVNLREMLGTHRELARKLAQLEQRIEGHDEEITAIFEAIRQLMEPPEKPPERIGSHG